MSFAFDIDRRRTFLFAVLAVTVFAALLRIVGLGSQPLSADDASVALSAANYVETGHLGPTMWNHPPLRNLVVYGTLSAWGTTPFGLKLMSVLLGTLTVGLLALVARRLLGDPILALVAAALLAVDGLHIDFSRQAVHEVYNACFGLAAIWAAFRFHDTQRWRWLGLAGVLFGLGLASKWGIAFPLVVTAGFLVFAWRPEPSAPRSLRISRSVLVCAVLAVVPLVVYTATFLPLFARGFGFVDWVSLHLSMLHETAHHQGYSAYALHELTNNALWWFVHPVGYAEFVIRHGQPTVFVGLTNPAVWMLAWPALIVLAVRAYRERALELALPVAYFAATYLPFVLVTRPIWVHSSFPAFTHALIAIAALVTRLLPRKLLWIYLAVVVLLAIPLYWLALGKGYDSSWLGWIVEMYRPEADRGLGAP